MHHYHIPLLGLTGTIAKPIRHLCEVQLALSLITTAPTWAFYHQVPGAYNSGEAECYASWCTRYNYSTSCNLERDDEVLNS